MAVLHRYLSFYYLALHVVLIDLWLEEALCFADLSRYDKGSARSTTRVAKAPITPLRERTNDDATIFDLDYRGANEFIDAHYGKADLAWQNKDNSASYFEASTCAKAEQVWNARKGVRISDDQPLQPPSLDGNGFFLVPHPTQVKDFTDFSQVQEVYLPELEAILQEQFDITSDSHHVLFWNPVLRGQAMQSSQDRVFDEATQTIQASAISTTANMVHIDTDIGAHETPESFLKIMYKNRVTTTPGTQEEPSLSQLTDAIAHGQRFVILNFWRNGDSNNPIIQTMPLGLFVPHYDPNSMDAFPTAQPCRDQSRWYYYPNMTYQETLVFKQYDRDASYVSDIWHSALRNQQPQQRAVPPRLSFDIRALVVSKTETVAPERDRYSHHRVRPIMDFSQSQVFCQEQDKRQTERDTTKP
ncbi:expressed unknown protein [Seminavis robusta]|uniref:Uncharacterized protein n=1 Tax=Seminavis robusta TaxID=568900 RepID=A0A9N8EDC7_9STRA|nr:expressed unknown protein [Seminavis robusta]|eukprot:Sro1011_g231040.1 n/a (415) ;mRNA; f:18505-19749